MSNPTYHPNPAAVLARLIYHGLASEPPESLPPAIDRQLPPLPSRILQPPVRKLLTKRASRELVPSELLRGDEGK